MKYKPYPTYKNSNVNWIDKIPEDWEMKKLLSDINIQTRSISVEKIKNEKTVFHYSIPNFDECKDGKEEESELIDSNKYLIEEELVLISKLNPRKNRVLIANKHPNLLTVCSTEFVPIKVKNLEKEFVLNLLNSEFLRQLLDSEVKSVTNSHKRIKPHIIPRIVLPIPPKNEQEEIISFINQESTKIDLTIAQYEKLIELLKEHKKSLISYVVTGQIDVRKK